MAYKIMKSLIASGSRSKDELSDMADVYYAAGRLTDEQYNEIINEIKKVEVMEA